MEVEETALLLLRVSQILRHVGTKARSDSSLFLDNGINKSMDLDVNALSISPPKKQGKFGYLKCHQVIVLSDSI